MTQLINKENINAVTIAEVEAQVKAELMQKGFIVVEDRAEAQQFFKDNFEGDNVVCSEIEQEFTMLGEVNGDWVTTLTVKIVSHFIDSGSNDYVYSVEVTED